MRPHVHQSSQCGCMSLYIHMVRKQSWATPATVQSTNQTIPNYHSHPYRCSAIFWMPADILQKIKQIPPLWFARIITCWLFETNWGAHKGHGRQEETDRQRQERKDSKTDKEWKTGILPPSQLAVFQVISLFFSFRTSLALPAQTSTQLSVDSVWTYRGQYNHTSHYKHTHNQGSI